MRVGHSDILRTFQCNVGNIVKTDLRFRKRKHLTFAEIRISHGYLSARFINIGLLDVSFVRSDMKIKDQRNQCCFQFLLIMKSFV